MSFREALSKAHKNRQDAADALELHLQSLGDDERQAFLELATSVSITAAYEALKDEGYTIGRETVTKWVRRYGV